MAGTTGAGVLVGVSVGAMAGEDSTIHGIVRLYMVATMQDTVHTTEAITDMRPIIIEEEVIKVIMVEVVSLEEDPVA